MTLENLWKIGQLKTHTTDRAEIRQLLAAVHRNLADAGVAAISPVTKFSTS